MAAIGWMGTFPVRAFVLLALVLSTGLVAPTLQAAPLLQTGTAEGTLRATAQGPVAAYLGVPYAAPPIGSRRWQPPHPPSSWRGVRRADRFAPGCMQHVAPAGSEPWTPEYVVQGPVSEDCLYLNVWTPAPSRGERLPVLVWIHGGGFTSGAGSVPIYDGAAIASQGIVVVSINYRLGIFGFLALPELSAESAQHTSGNYGLLDVLAALRWIHTNIAAFGGDPAAVTLAGQSAGAAAIVDLDSSPSSASLYARAIAQSGAGLNLPLATLSQAERTGIRIEHALGAASLSALRALPADALERRARAAGNAAAFAPIVDGRLLTGQPAQLLAAGHLNHTPFLTGLVADENSAMVPDYGAMTTLQCEATFQRLFGSDADAFEALYPPAGSDCNASMKQLLRERGMLPPSSGRRRAAATTRRLSTCTSTTMPSLARRRVAMAHSILPRFRTSFARWTDRHLAPSRKPIASSPGWSRTTG